MTDSRHETIDYSSDELVLVNLLTGELVGVRDGREVPLTSIPIDATDPDTVPTEVTSDIEGRLEEIQND